MNSQSRRSWPLGFVGMIGLILVCETWLSNHAPDFMGESAVSWRWGTRSAERDAPGAETLCFGDSVVKFGVAPRVIESWTGRKTWNLAVLGGRPANSYFLLRHALASGARPTALIFDADLLHSTPYEIPYIWPYSAQPGEVIRDGLVGQGFRLFAPLRTRLDPAFESGAGTNFGTTSQPDSEVSLLTFVPSRTCSIRIGGRTKVPGSCPPAVNSTRPPLVESIPGRRTDRDRASGLLIPSIPCI